jgi:hypothetical protein
VVLASQKYAESGPNGFFDYITCFCDEKCAVFGLKKCTLAKKYEPNCNFQPKTAHFFSQKRVL